MIGLAKQIQEHRGAIEYDLLTKTGHSIDDIGRSLSWDALDSFLSNIGLDSALGRELHPEEAEWCTTTKANKMLAEVIDLLAQINANLVAIGDKKPAKKPKPYPRPWKKGPSAEEKHIGSGALPPDKLRQWFEGKRAEHARSSTGHNNSHSGNGWSTAENN